MKRCSSLVAPAVPGGWSARWAASQHADQPAPPIRGHGGGRRYKRAALARLRFLAKLLQPRQPGRLF
ncbi:MAG TPA: hypothetical protein VF099_08325, partial [Ktedonobacterales bacterium]